jgi:TonB-dependent starch-binding outer membrane protein SusC
MKRFIKTNLGIFLAIFFSQSVLAQKITIRGVVTDEEKVTIPGVSVTVAGTDVATMTAINGEFSIEALPTDKLKFSFIGMENKTVDLQGRIFLNVVLKTTVENLDEVVVIGYEAVKRSDITGSISSIKGRDITKQATPNLASALVGKASGVYVRTTGSEPGGSNSIKIRGVNSINGNGEPLYIVDGIYSDDINFLNPSDVESIEILKDASATAIYGSRGANGVVLVTTKKPKSGEVNTTYSNYFTYKDLTRQIQVVNAKEYAELFYEFKANRPDLIPASQEIVGFPQNNTASWGDGYDWVKSSEQPWTLQNHDFKISYGKAESSIGLAVNYLKDNGTFKNQDFVRFNIKLDGMMKVSKAFEVGYSAYLTRSKYNHLRDGQKAVETIYGITPVTPIYNPDGSYSFKNMFGVDKTFENPLARLENSIDDDKTDRILSDVYASFNISPKLKLRASLKYNYSIRNRQSYLPITTLEGSLTSGKANLIDMRSAEYTNNYILTYSLTKGKSSITTLSGLEISGRERTSSTSGDVTQFNTDLYGPYNLSAGILATGFNSSKSYETLAGFLGRINYKFDDKYFITLTGRYDGSSKFGANNRWAFFPGVALAWDVFKEKFLSDSKTISNLKIRISAGRSGSSDILPYQSQGSIYSLGLFTSGNNYSFGNKVVAGEVPQTFDNPDLKWEVTTQYNAGLDLSLFNGRINFSGEVYKKEISDLLVKDFALPGVSGFETSSRNGGNMTNTGFEFTLGGDVVKNKKFTMSSNIVFSHYKNEVTKWFGGGQFIKPTKYSGYVGEGYAYGVFWEVPQLGVFADQQDVNDYTHIDPTTGAVTLIQPTALPGDIKFKDTDGNGVINLNDQTVVGSPHPDFTLGLGLDFTYKKWSLNVFINSVHGKDVYNASNEQLMNTQLFNTNKYDEPFGEATTMSTRVLNRWTPTNPITDVPRLGSTTGAGLSPIVSNVENGDFIRFENISLSYKIPFGKNSFAKSASAFASVQNAILITKYRGTDPESNQPDPGGWATNQSSSILALDNFGYPRPVVYTFGLNFNF